MNRLQKIASSVYVGERYYQHFKNMVVKMAKEKGKKRPIHLNIRKDWGELNPVTRVVKNKSDSSYNRKDKSWKKDLNNLYE